MYGVKKKKAVNQNGWNPILIGVLGILVFVFLFGIVIYTSHMQLGIEQENTKIFVSNNINIGAKFVREQVSLPAITDSVLRWEEAILNTSWIGSNQYISWHHVNGHEVEPIASTPRATKPFLPLSCPHGDLVQFWKPNLEFDYHYVSPFANVGPRDKYVTFEPDVGGWNNIRMQMETVLVFAAATGRTLVLPPDQPMYLLGAGKGHQKAHNFADFFPFDHMDDKVKVISMEEFMAREGVTGHLRDNVDKQVRYPPNNKTEFIGTDRDDRNLMWDYIRNVTTCPTWKCMKEFVIIPPGPGVNVSLLSNAAEYALKQGVFAATRRGYYYDDYWQQQSVIHFISKPGMGFRLLEHFYTFVHFEDDAMDRYYKRFVRDYVHYIDTIFCKAAIIVNHLLLEGGGNYSSFHIRRGEFQYKEVKIPAAEIMTNIGHHVPAGQLVFIATDERNKSFFDPFKTRFPQIRYLDDFIELADLKGINPNYLGMIDQIVCTRGEVFVGTWFSTFTGYITRMRGYMGKHDHSVWYGDKKHMDRFQNDELPKFPFYMREWNLSWANIDY